MADSTLLQELRLNLSMAECAMTKFQGAQSRFKGLMLASLAGVVFFGQNGLSTGNTWAEVTATLSTINVKLGDQCLTARLRAFELLLLSIGRRVPSEELEG